jgi:translocation and assembly module TamA
LLKRLFFILWALCLSEMVSFSADDTNGYDVDMIGVKDAALKRAIREVSVCCKLMDQPPPMTGQLRVRMQKDLPVVKTLLDSNGYYNSNVSADLVMNGKKQTVLFTISMGDAFLFRTVDLRFTGPADAQIQELKLLLSTQEEMSSQKVLREQNRILKELSYRGYPFPRLKKRTIQIDHENHAVDLLLEFDPGDRAAFGEVELVGLIDLDPNYVTRQLPWKPTDLYDQRKISALEKKLLTSGLFTAVEINTLPSEEGSRAVPVSIILRERTKRTLLLGATYSDIGPGAKIDWEHRNLLGGGEHFETALFWDPIKYGAEASVLQPGFLDPDQSLLLTLEGVDDSPDAYDAQRVKGQAMIYRDFTPQIKGGMGIGYKFSEVDQLSSSESYSHILFPLEAAFDGRDDLLNPVDGVHSFVRTTYYADTQAGESFLKTLVEGRHYHLFSDRHQLSSALRLSLGSIMGSSLSSVPADERFYAGGGGSIRGYEYQSVGPQTDGTPTGGNQLVEFSAELRLRPGQKVGYAVFLDGGTVYDDLIEDSSRSLRYGAGIGLRFFTAIGPLRVDLAYPLNPDSVQVERMQFYISLGQAF